MIQEQKKVEEKEALEVSTNMGRVRCVSCESKSGISFKPALKQPSEGRTSGSRSVRAKTARSVTGKHFQEKYPNYKTEMWFGGGYR